MRDFFCFTYFMRSFIVTILFLFIPLFLKSDSFDEYGELYEEVYSVEDLNLFYTSLDQNLNMIAQLIMEISFLDLNQRSPINLLKNYIGCGGKTISYNNFLDVLEYAESFLDDQPDSSRKRLLIKEVDKAVDQVLNKIKMVVLLEG